MASTTMSCPATGQPFEVTVEVPVETGERVDRASLGGSPAAAGQADSAGSPAEPAARALAPPGSVAGPAVNPTPDGAEADWRPGEFAEWRKNSITVARDTAAKLLGAGTAAIGAYFAILKVVAGESVAGGNRVLAIAPAFAYLLATVLAAVALLPVLRRVFDPEEFERFREDRLKRLNALLAASVSVFVLGTALAAIAYAVLL